MKFGFLLFGAALLIGFLLVALLGDRIAPYDPADQDLLAILDPPSAAHWFGTDEIGRDIASRIIAGTRITLLIAVVSVALAGVAGIGLGLAAGYRGGAVDRVLMVVLDLLMTIPSRCWRSPSSRRPAPTRLA